MRTMKAARLVGALQERSLTPAEAAHMTQAARRAIERSAGVRIGSAQTWRTAVDMLAGSARVKCPTCGLGDPDGTYGPIKAYGHSGPCAR
jgi:hypothetical protein